MSPPFASDGSPSERLQVLHACPPKSNTMKRIGTLYLAGIGAFSGILGGCGSSAPPLNTSAWSSLSAVSSSATPKQRRPLLYATSGDSQMLIYTYPRLKQVFDLSPGLQPETECSDQRGDVFVSTLDGLIEYRHGGVSPVATIGIESEGCSVDPVTGDLAVTEYAYGVLIFRSTKLGWHVPAKRTPPFQPTSSAYDGHGNLFVDGSTSGDLDLAELPKGTKTFTSIQVNRKIKAVGSIQWDGKHIAVTDTQASPPTIYRYSISGSAATLAGTTKLSGATRVAETWIFDGHVFGAVDYYNLGVGMWKYPGGGSPIKTIPIDPAGGVTVSI